MGRPSYQCCTKPSSWFWCRLKFENYRAKLIHSHSLRWWFLNLLFSLQSLYKPSTFWHLTDAPTEKQKQSEDNLLILPSPNISCGSISIPIYSAFPTYTHPSFTRPNHLLIHGIPLSFTYQSFSCLLLSPLFLRHPVIPLEHEYANLMDMSLSEFRELVMDRETWRAEIHGIAKSWTRLSDWTELMLNTFHLKTKRLFTWPLIAFQL